MEYVCPDGANALLKMRNVALDEQYTASLPSWFHEIFMSQTCFSPTSFRNTIKHA